MATLLKKLSLGQQYGYESFRSVNPMAGEWESNKHRAQTYRLSSALRPQSHDMHLLLVWSQMLSEQGMKILSKWAVGYEGQKMHRCLLEDFKRPQSPICLALCLGAMTSFERLKYYGVIPCHLPLKRHLIRDIKFLESMSYLYTTIAYRILNTSQAQMIGYLLSPNLACTDPVAEFSYEDNARYWEKRLKLGCDHSTAESVS